MRQCAAAYKATGYPLHGPINNAGGMARVVNVSSQTHIPGFGGGPPPGFDWDNLKAEKYYSQAVFYKNVKLITMMWDMSRQWCGLH